MLKRKATIDDIPALIRLRKKQLTDEGLPPEPIFDIDRQLTDYFISALTDGTFVSWVGEFKLRSGQVSNEYFDKYLFEANPVLLKDFANLMVTAIPVNSEVLVGLEMGGIPIATALSMQTGIAAALVRKEAKKYGTCKLAEGAEVFSKQVCIVEDVVTTGGVIIDRVRELRKIGAVIYTVICVIQRDDKATEILAEHDLKLIPAFTMNELLEAVKND